MVVYTLHHRGATWTIETAVLYAKAHYKYAVVPATARVELGPAHPLAINPDAEYEFEADGFVSTEPKKPAPLVARTRTLHPRAATTRNIKTARKTGKAHKSINFDKAGLIPDARLGISDLPRVGPPDLGFLFID